MDKEASTVAAELFSEGWLFAALLDMVVEHCGTGQDDVIKSFGWDANARAMRLLAEAAYIEIIDGDEENDLAAIVTDSGRALMARAAGR